MLFPAALGLRTPAGHRPRAIGSGIGIGFLGTRERWRQWGASRRFFPSSRWP